MISAVALPLSAIPTFWIMDLMGFSLNLVSFLALTLATGILVDDAIVEIENIARHIKMGKTPYRAAIEAADEIGLAVIATTFTIIAVFVPVSFMPGIPGPVLHPVRPDGCLLRLLLAHGGASHHADDGRLPDACRRRHADDHHDNDGAFLARLHAARDAPRRRLVDPLCDADRGDRASSSAPSCCLLQVPGSFLPPEDASRIVLSVELPPNATLDDTDSDDR